MNPQKTVLPNGLRVVSETIPSAQSFALGVWVDAGSRDELPKEHGMVHFIEHLVFRGTKKRTARRIANELESVGGYINAFTTKDHTCYYTRALTQHFDLSLSVLADICIAPLFRENDIIKERSIIIEEIKSLQDEAEELITDYLDESLFGRHPYAHPISGTPTSLARIQRSDITAFHRANYTADRIIVAAAGSIDHEILCRRVEELFAETPVKALSLPSAYTLKSHNGIDVASKITPRKAVSTRKAVSNGAVLSPADTLRTLKPPVRRPARLKEIQMTTQQSHFCMGTLLPSATDEEYYTLSALNIVLGDGMSSRLNQVVREKHGLCYNVYSATNEIGQTLIMSIYASCEPSERDNVEALIDNEVQNFIDKPISKAELQRAKEQLKSGLIIGLESLSGRMTLLAKSELYLGMFEPIEEKITKIEAVTAEEIQILAAQYLAKDAWHKVVIMPKDPSAPRRNNTPSASARAATKPDAGHTRASATTAQKKQ